MAILASAAAIIRSLPAMIGEWPVAKMIASSMVMAGSLPAGSTGTPSGSCTALPTALWSMASTAVIFCRCMVSVSSSIYFSVWAITTSCRVPMPEPYRAEAASSSRS